MEPINQFGGFIRPQSIIEKMDILYCYPLRFTCGACQEEK